MRREVELCAEDGDFVEIRWICGGIWVTGWIRQDGEGRCRSHMAQRSLSACEQLANSIFSDPELSVKYKNYYLFRTRLKVINPILLATQPTPRYFASISNI